MQTTRLEQFLKTWKIKPAHLARETGYCRQHVLRIRKGRMKPSQKCIEAIAAACRKMSGQNVGVTDLYGGPTAKSARGGHTE